MKMNDKKFARETDKLVRAKLIPVLESLGFKEDPAHFDDPTKFGIFLERITSGDTQYMSVDTISWLDSYKMVMLFRFNVTTPIPLQLTEFLDFDERPELGWMFTTIKELDIALDEIVDLAQNDFKQWIENPKPIFQPHIEVDLDARLKALDVSIIQIKYKLEEATHPEKIRKLEQRIAELQVIHKRTKKEIEDRDNR